MALLADVVAEQEVAGEAGAEGEVIEAVEEVAVREDKSMIQRRIGSEKRGGEINKGKLGMIRRWPGQLGVGK